MIKRKLIFLLTIPCILCFAHVDSFGNIRVGNKSRSYAGAYQQMNSIQQQEDYYKNQVIEAPVLPIRVADQDLAANLLSNKSGTETNISQLEACSAIYPNGEFAWDKPTAGRRSSSSDTCVSVVEMRVVKGTEDIVVARINLAAGDFIKCNISDFPESSYTIEAGNVIFPADKAPTMDDVIKMLNQEQKKNAGLKIAAGTVIGGLLGNVAGKNDIGNDGLMGTDKGKVQSSLVGAVSGAAIMTGSAYAGKVGGDMIMSGGVNAAMGGIMGNIVATGNSVLRIEPCKTLSGASSSCLWGVIEKNTPIDYSKEEAYYNIDSQETIVCDIETGKCKKEQLIAISFHNGSNKKFSGYKSIQEGRGENFLKMLDGSTDIYSYNSTLPNAKIETGYSGDEGRWFKAASAGRPGQRIVAMIEDFKDKSFGLKMSDWYKWRGANQNTDKIVGRNARGEAYALTSVGNTDDSWTIDDFYPLALDASDGGLIDISNKARLKSTMIGAGAGGGLGAFTAYQGAQDEIDQRWVGAVQEHKDSLQKVYCGTGKRFLTHYNDDAIIPNMIEPEND